MLRLPLHDDGIILSVATGTGKNASYRWGAHQGRHYSYKPIYTFCTRSVQSHKDEGDNDRGGNHNDRENEYLPFVHYFETRVLEWMGGASFAQRPTLENLLEYLRNFRIPYLQIYVLIPSLASTEQQQLHMEHLKDFFGPVPCCFHQLEPSDFLPALRGSVGGLSKPDSPLLDGGVEHIARLIGAHYPNPGQPYHASAALVIDSDGPVLTWSTTNVDGSYTGGGMGLSLGLRFQAMESHAAISRNDIMNVLDMCNVSQEPLNLDTRSSPRLSTCQHLIVGVLHELALLLSNLVQRWVAELEHGLGNDMTPQTPWPVYLTGADAKLLKVLLSPHILAYKPAHTNALRKVKIKTCSGLPNWGIASALQEYQREQEQQPSLLDQLRLNFLGLRLMAPQQNGKRLYGTICDIKWGDNFGNDFFDVHYDDGTRACLDIVNIYGGLLQFGLIDEGGSSGDDFPHAQLAREAVDALVFQISDIDAQWAEKNDAEKESIASLCEEDELQPNEMDIEMDNEAVPEEENAHENATVAVYTTAAPKAVAPPEAVDQPQELARTIAVAVVAPQAVAPQVTVNQKLAADSTALVAHGAPPTEEPRPSLLPSHQSNIAAVDLDDSSSEDESLAAIAKQSKANRQAQTSSQEMKKKRLKHLLADSQKTNNGTVPKPKQKKASTASSPATHKNNSSASVASSSQQKSKAVKRPLSSNPQPVPTAKKMKKANTDPTTVSAAKKTKIDPTDAVAARKRALKKILKNPNSFINSRVAKKFDGVNFFGTVVSHWRNAEDGNLWYVVYDDGDAEDYSPEELHCYLAFYKKVAKEDPKRHKK